MGEHYKAAAKMHQWKRQYILDELVRLNVTHTAAGESILELSYEDLKEELVLATFKRIDVNNESGRWF